MILVSIIATPIPTQATSENSIGNERAKMEWNTFKEVKKIKKAVVNIKTWVIIYFITSLVVSLIVGASKN